jgi:hypothetical protein
MARAENTRAQISAEEKAYLSMGLRQAGGKLPLFDSAGQEIKHTTIRNCLEKGYAQRWFANPLKPDWLVCRLTDAGREALNKFG